MATLAERLKLKHALSNLDSLGYVILYSSLFNEKIAFCTNQYTKPTGYTSYTNDELYELFGDGRSTSKAMLKYIHESKKLGASVIADE